MLCKVNRSMIYVRSKTAIVWKPERHNPLAVTSGPTAEPVRGRTGVACAAETAFFVLVFTTRVHDAANVESSGYAIALRSSKIV